MGVKVDEKTIHSKLKTMAFPGFEEVNIGLYPHKTSHKTEASDIRAVQISFIFSMHEFSFFFFFSISLSLFCPCLNLYYCFSYINFSMFFCQVPIQNFLFKYGVLERLRF